MAEHQADPSTDEDYGGWKGGKGKKGGKEGKCRMPIAAPTAGVAPQAKSETAQEEYDVDWWTWASAAEE